MRKKNKNFKNSPYVDFYIKPKERILEILKTFWGSKANWFSSKKSKRYFLEEKYEKWMSFSVPYKSSFKPTITWIGHSSFLIQIGGFNILTDPIFFDLLFLYPRNFDPGIALKDLPKIDFVLISHKHDDHFNKKTLLFLKKHDPVFLIPSGTRKWFDKKKFVKVIEKDWWEDSCFLSKNSTLENIKISFLPAVHWAGNRPYNIDKSVWGSWMIEFAGFKIYFLGDSAYSKHFTEISTKFFGINVAVVPIAPNQPRELTKYSHIDAGEAIQAFIDLKADCFIPMHWGTFRLGADKFIDPIKKLKKSWEEKEIILKDKRLNILKIGQRIDFDFDFPTKRLFGCELF